MGRISILSADGDNYKVFESTCQFALITAGAWSIVDNTEEEPDLQARGGAMTHQDWVSRRQKANQIISGSIDRTLIPLIRPYVLSLDVSGMWKALATQDQTSDPVFLAALRNQFFREDFHPERETIRSFVTRLSDIRTKLEGTQFEQSDSDLQSQILQALPNDLTWQNTKQHCLLQKLSLSETINTLKSLEYSRLPQQETAMAAYSSRKPKGQYQAGKSTQIKGKDQGCWFCTETDHNQRDCPKYKSARKHAWKTRGLTIPGTIPATEATVKLAQAASLAAHTRLTDEEDALNLANSTLPGLRLPYTYG